MNENEIDNILWSHPATKHVYRGSFAIDELPDKPDKPYALVLNYDERSRDGSHWVCIHASDKPTFFDSFGLTPLKIQIPAFFDPEEYDAVVKQLQHKRATTCGHHVISFLVKRCEGLSNEQYLSQFGDNRRANDDAVYDFVNDLKRVYDVM